MMKNINELFVNKWLFIGIKWIFLRNKKITMQECDRYPNLNAPTVTVKLEYFITFVYTIRVIDNGLNSDVYTVYY